jgi:hypothetical protein
MCTTRSVISRSVATAFLLGVFLTNSSCGDGNSPIEPGPVCSYALTPATATVASDTTTGTVTVTAPAGCAWSATTTVSWISIGTGANGNGNGTATYAVLANTATESRTGQIMVGGQGHRVTQQGRAPTVCQYTLSPASAEWSKDEARGSFAVTAQADCAWTATKFSQLARRSFWKFGDRGRYRFVLRRREPRSGRTDGRNYGCGQNLRGAADRRHQRLSILGRAGDLQPMYAGRSRHDYGDDTGRMLVDGHVKRAVADGAERWFRIWHRADYARVFRQLRRAPRRHCDGALANADRRPERARGTSRLRLHAESEWIELHRKRSIRQLRRDPAESAAIVRRRDPGSLHLDRRGRRSVDRGEYPDAASRRWARDVLGGREYNWRGARRANHRARQSRDDYAESMTGVGRGGFWHDHDRRRGSAGARDHRSRPPG